MFSKPEAIRQAYEILLQRGAAPQELSYWRDTDAADAVRTIANSHEAMQRALGYRSFEMIQSVVELGESAGRAERAAGLIEAFRQRCWENQTVPASLSTLQQGGDKLLLFSLEVKRLPIYDMQAYAPLLQAVQGAIPERDAEVAAAVGGCFYGHHLYSWLTTALGPRLAGPDVLGPALSPLLCEFMKNPAGESLAVLESIHGAAEVHDLARRIDAVGSRTARLVTLQLS